MRSRLDVFSYIGQKLYYHHADSNHSSGKKTTREVADSLADNVSNHLQFRLSAEPIKFLPPVKRVLVRSDNSERVWGWTASDRGRCLRQAERINRGFMRTTCCHNNDFFKSRPTRKAFCFH